VKSNQSPTLQNLAEAHTSQPLQGPSSPQTESPAPELQSPQNPQSHEPESHNGEETPTLRPQLPVDPPGEVIVLPHAPPPSSAEISTAGNTAPSSPSSKYIRPPRMTPQSLHDKLLNATLATLQESPLLRAALGQPVVGDEMISLDTTAGTIPVETAIKEEWVSPLRSNSGTVV
jgi:hypothetical protein